MIALMLVQFQDSKPDAEVLIVMGRRLHLSYMLFGNIPDVRASWEHDGKFPDLRVPYARHDGSFAGLRRAAIDAATHEAETDVRCKPYLDRLQRAELGMEELRREAEWLGAWEWNNTLAGFICDARYSVVNAIRSSPEPARVLEEFFERALAAGVCARALKGFPRHGPDPS